MYRDAISSAAREWGGLTVLLAVAVLVAGFVVGFDERMPGVFVIAAVIELLITRRALIQGGRRLRYAARAWWR